MHDVFRDLQHTPREETVRLRLARAHAVRFRYLRLSSDLATHLGNCRYNGTPDTRDPLQALCGA
jgi:hypothetical protein